MTLTDLNHLKNLSWYTTVPMFVCAWMLQDSNSIANELQSIWGFIFIVGVYFVKVIGALIITYISWLYASVYLDDKGLPLTLILATFLLTISSVGVGVYFYKPIEITLPVNIVCFFSCGSVAFNLYQIHSNIVTNDEKPHGL